MSSHVYARSRCVYTMLRHSFGMPMLLSMAPFELIDHNDKNEGQHEFFGHVMPLALILASYDAISIVKGTTAFHNSRQLK